MLGRLRLRLRLSAPDDLRLDWMALDHAAEHQRASMTAARQDVVALVLELRGDLRPLIRLGPLEREGGERIGLAAACHEARGEGMADVELHIGHRYLLLKEELRS